MSPFLRLRQRVTRRLLAGSLSGPLDLRQLRRLPEPIRLPFRRNGLDPVAELSALRADHPVHKLADLFGRGAWLVSGYAEARAVLADGASWSNDLGQFVPQDGRADHDRIGGLGMTDPPGHTTLRRYLTPEFTRNRIARLEPAITRIVEESIDALEGSPDPDLVRDFAFPVPFQVICELLGLPDADRPRFQSLGVARFDLSAGASGSFAAAGESRRFLIDAVARQRRDPGPGLIGALLTAHGDELDDVTLGGLADGVFLGGYETSASTLALGSYLLATHPDAMALVRDDDAAVDGVVEELLRYLSVVQLAFVRIARHDVELGGRTIRAGDVVGVSLLAANRDPALGPDLDRFDPRREPTRHLAFGHGLHRCVGAELARMELRIALRSLARRLPDLGVTVGLDELDFRQMSAVYGVERLPVRLHGRIPDPV